MMRQKILRLILIVVGFPFFCSFGAPSKHPLTFDDLMQVRRVSDPHVSPDGKWVAYSVAEVNKVENTRNAHIWLVSIEGGEPRQLTRSEKDDSRPRWSPDGKNLAFVSTRDGSAQIWLLPLQGGESRKITSIATEAGGVLFCPDGKQLMFTSDVYPECDNPDPRKALDANAARKKAFDDSKVKAHVATRLLFRHWTEWKDGKRTHLFIVPVDASQPPRDLTPGDFDVPPFSLGGPDDYAFSPDGKELCYSSNHDRHEERSTDQNLFVVNLATGETKSITTNPAYDGCPQYSPDGRFVAYRAQLRPGYESDRFRLMLYDRATGQHRNLTQGFDRWVESFAWAPDCSRLFVVAGDRGHNSIFAVPLSGNAVERIYAVHSSDDLELTPDGRTIVFTRSSMHQPAEVYRANVDGSGVAALTHHNDRLLETLDMNPAEEFWLDGSASSSGPKVDPAVARGFIDPKDVDAALPHVSMVDTPRVHCWMVKPPQFDEAKQYPMLLLVHGGPQSSWEDNWGFRWNPQMYAGAGYVVVMPDPRGSTGYGQQFIDEVRGDWGGRCFKDLMLATDTAEKLPFIDRTRMVAAGASFGGFMVNWFQGHTDRFRALVAHAGDFDEGSSYYVTEELWFPEWELLGTPYDNPELYDFLSPGRYVKNFKTPELVTHGELDFRVPLGEGLAMFTALQRRGIESKLLCFPDEGHWILKPLNSELFYKTAIEWLDRFDK